MRDDASFAVRVLSLVGEGVWEWDLPRDEVRHNPSLNEMLALELQGRPESFDDFVARVHEDDWARVRGLLDDCLAGLRSYDCEFRMRRADGRVIWVHDRGEVMTRDPGGTPLRMAGSVRDITAQREAETALRESDSRFRDLAANIPGAIFRYILHPDGRDEIEYMSPGCLDIWEIGPEQLQTDPTPLWEMVHPDDLPEMQRSVMASAEKLSPWSQVWRVTTPSGRKKVVHGRGQPQLLDDGSILWNSLILDITAQRQTEEDLREAKEEAETATRAMVEFLAHMSHELRTPLNGIVGFSEIMRSEMFGSHTSSRYREYSEMIHDSASHLRDLLADLIDISKIESGNLILAEDWFDLDTVIDFCREVLNERILEAKLNLEVELPSNGLRLFGDEIRIKQVLLNLLGNAIKFTPVGGCVTVAGRPRGDGFEIRVRDTGIGIPGDELPQVTKAFRQVRSDVTRSSEGIGLGLYICDKIMQLHGAEMSISSQPGEGTEVTLVLPGKRVDLFQKDGSSRSQS